MTVIKWLKDDHFTRLFKMLDHELRPKTAEIFMMASDCFPTGRAADMQMATMKQLWYIAALADEPSHEKFTPGWYFVIDAQMAGMSKTMAGHVIGKYLALKEQPKELSK